MVRPKLGCIDVARRSPGPHQSGEYFPEVAR